MDNGHGGISHAMEGMPMNLRTYRAYSMAEALAAVKRDLGPDAVILHTRTTRKGGWFGIGRATIVEVTAVPAEDAAKDRRPRKRPLQAASAAKAYGGSAAGRTATPTRASGDAMDSSTLAEQQRKTREFARAMLERLESEQGAAASAVPQDAVSGAAAPRRAEQQATSPPSAAQRFVLQSAEQRHATDGSDTSQRDTRLRQVVEAKPVPAVAGDRGATSPTTPGLDDMQSELTAIRQMVGQVLHRQGGGGSSNLPGQLFDQYLKLIAQDLSEDLADSIVNEVRAALSENELEDAACVQAALRQRLTAYVPCCEQPLTVASPDERALTIALVGPTGVGKTTTLAKLAATLKLQHDRTVGLITCDTYRIAAVDQLRTYAGIIGLPLEVVQTPAEMSRAVARMQHLDAILIDTAGRSQRDAGRIDELRQFISAAEPHEVHLVLSSTASEKVLLQEAEAFACVGVDKLVFTKLDEAVSFGMLINVARRIGTQLSYFTTGQEVPDHLEVSQPSRLAELVLGGALHT